MIKNEKELIEQLKAAFGNILGQKVFRKVKAHKAANKGKVFSYVFAEDGSFKAFDKKLEDEEEQKELN